MRILCHSTRIAVILDFTQCLEMSLTKPSILVTAKTLRGDVILCLAVVILSPEVLPVCPDSFSPEPRLIIGQEKPRTGPHHIIPSLRSLSSVSFTSLLACPSP